MLFLDCEFNGHNGMLISMALVADNGDEFYEVLPYSVLHINDWVQDNVIPVLNKAPVASYGEFREKLWDFLAKHPRRDIVADSPADFIYLLEHCHHMTSENKYRYISQDLYMRFVTGTSYVSKIPHNALEDARALKEWWFTGP